MMDDDEERQENPLLSATADAPEVDEESQSGNPRGKPTSLAYRVLAAVSVVCFGASTIFLALSYPVKKHKFSRFRCISHSELAALEIAALQEVAPFAVQAVCTYEHSMCQESRRRLGDEKLFNDQQTIRDDLCSVDANLTFCSENITSACIASAGCDAITDYWHSPNGFCMNSTLMHEENCVKSRDLIHEAEQVFWNYCSSQGIIVEKACTALNVSLHDRGHWEAYCQESIAHRLECKAIQAAIQTELDNKFCSISTQNQKICNAAYAIAERYGDTSQPLPIYTALTEAAEIYCSEGICSPGPTFEDRFHNGSTYEEIQLLETQLPSICQAWPMTEEYCTNATSHITAFCHTYPIACEWLAQLTHFNASQAEELFFSTWQAADRVCQLNNSARATESTNLLNTSPSLLRRARNAFSYAAIRHAFDQHQEGQSLAFDTFYYHFSLQTDNMAIALSQITDYACDAVNLIDDLAESCPSMLPEVYHAISSEKSVYQ